MLDGTLVVFLDGGFEPAASDIFNVITYNTRVGIFSVLRGESPGAQMDFSIDTATDPRTLKVKGASPGSTVQPGTDLVATNLLPLPQARCCNPGSSVTVEWQDHNNGSVATATSWTDRLLVRNLDTNEILATCRKRTTQSPAARSPVTVAPRARQPLCCRTAIGARAICASR